MAQDFLVLYAARVVDGRHKEPLQDGAVLVQSGRIVQVGRADEVQVPPEAEIVRAGDCTLMPGLIDAHIHIQSTGSPQPGSPLAESQALTALRAYSHARQALEMGFTTLRSLGSPHYVDVGLRDAIDQGILEGPRLKVAGQSLSTTGGHGDQGRWSSDVVVAGRTGVCDGPWECRRATRAEIKRGVDVIKISGASIGTSVDLDHPWFQDMAYEEMAAICEQAHWFKKRVAAHTAGGPGSTDAIRAGVDSMEHSHWLSDEQIEMMAERGTFYVPTLIVNERSVESQRIVKSNNSARSYAWLAKARDEKWDTLSRARAAGVKIVLGTDAGFLVRHGENACELEELVKGGFSPMEAIMAGTRVAADCLDMEREVGTLEPGKYADLVLVGGDPLADITLLKDRDRIARVYLGGKRIK